MENGVGASKLQAALDWAARGFKVFPLRPRSKLPLQKGWYDIATSDPETIRALWVDPVTGWENDYNIGCLTDDLIVVDIDVKNGKPGRESFAALGLPTDTLIVHTPTGGEHVYYATDVGALANSSGSLGLGLDTRSYHGFVLAPGSETEAGPYLVHSDTGVAVAPESLVRALRLPTRTDVRGHGAQVNAPMGELDLAANVKRAIDYLEREALVAIEGASGDHTTFKVAATLKDYGVSEDVAFELMATKWNDRCIPEWSQEELRQKVANAYAYGRSAPGSATPEAFIAGLDIDPVVEPVKPGRHWFDHGDAWNADASWLYFDMLPECGVVALTGPSQGGKTFLALELARCTGTGKPFFGVSPDNLGASIFLFAGSEGSGLGRRLQALQEEKPLPIAATVIGVLSAPGTLAALVEDIEAKAAELHLLHGVPLRLIVLETLSASGLLKDENDNSEAAMALAALNTLARRLNVLVVFTHHPPKEGKGSRGAGAIIANADYALEIVREGRDKVRVLDLAKARDAEQRRLGYFSLVEVVLGVDAKGREVKSLAVRPVDANEARSSVKQPPGTDQFVQALEWCATDGAVQHEGVSYLPTEAVKHYFRDQNAGKDRSNVHRRWQACVEWAASIGIVQQRIMDGATYLVRPLEELT